MIVHNGKGKHKKALEWRSYEHAKTEVPKMIIVIAKCVSGVSPSEAATSRSNLVGQPSKGTSALAPVPIQFAQVRHAQLLMYCYEDVTATVSRAKKRKKK